ncbi:hypothetical protein [Minwuia thermotolerans]|uniref:Uncharacterized protein n=1 Tax=Minwuia thermotolerans TaxID=2056226 RepID=A0A2M9G1T1_9PROT|nr:hypothetical protein [Minwuia thermotolerans]PJK29669.1 hypothetical protein CVT23_11535 [Minwuia thermotolerans]
MKPTLLTAALALLATASGAALAEPKDEVLNLSGGDARGILIDRDGDGRGDERATVLGQVSEIRGDVHYARYAVDLDNDGVADRWVVRAKTVGSEREMALNATPGGPPADTDVGAGDPIIPTE